MQKGEKAKNCEKKKEAAAARASTAPSSSKSTKTKYISIRNGLLNLLIEGEETEEEEVVDMGGGGSEIEESERSSVDIDSRWSASTQDPFLMGYTKASYSYKIWKVYKGRLFKKK